MRKGQLSMFLLFGVIIIATFLFVLFITSQVRFGLPEVTTISLQDFVESGVRDFVGPYCLMLLGIHGGYYDNIPNYLETKMGKTAFAYSTSFTDLESMQQEVSSCVNAHIPSFLEKADYVKERGGKFTFGTPKTETIFTETGVSFFIDYPISFTEDGTEVTLQEFKPDDIPIKIRTLHAEVERIIADEDEMINLDQLDNEPSDTTIVERENQQYLVILEDKNSLIRNEPYRFMFAESFTEASAAQE